MVPSGSALAGGVRSGPEVWPGQPVATLPRLAPGLPEVSRIRAFEFPEAVSVGMGRRYLSALGWLAGVGLLSGALAGVIWHLIAPGWPAFPVSGPNNSTWLFPEESESQVAADAQFGIIVAVIGLLLGLFAWFWFRKARGPLMPLVLVLVTLAAAEATRLTGQALSSGPAKRPDGWVVQPMRLHGSAAMLLAPFLAVMVYLICAGLAKRSADPDSQVV